MFRKPEQIFLLFIIQMIIFTLCQVFTLFHSLYLSVSFLISFSFSSLALFILPLSPLSFPFFFPFPSFFLLGVGVGGGNRLGRPGPFGPLPDLLLSPCLFFHFFLSLSLLSFSFSPLSLSLLSPLSLSLSLARVGGARPARLPPPSDPRLRPTLSFSYTLIVRIAFKYIFLEKQYK